MNSFPERMSFIDEVEIGRGAKHDQITHSKHNLNTRLLPRFCRNANFFTPDRASPSSTRQHQKPVGTGGARMSSRIC
jgi:hypothetical protein